MTNKLALTLGLVIIGLIAFDYYQYDWANAIFLLRKFAALIEWMAFWR